MITESEPQPKQPQLTTKKRKPLLAALLSAITPGLGQLYNGQALKGALFFVSMLIVNPVVMRLSVHSERNFLSFVVICVVLYFAIYAAAIVHAYKVARAIGENYRMNRLNQAWIYIALILVGNMLITTPLAHQTKASHLETFIVPSTTMLPSIFEGDQFLADKTIGQQNMKDKIKRGDIVIYISPKDKSVRFVQRVIGLGGDRVEIIKDEVFVNGKSIRTQAVSDFGVEELNALLTDHHAFQETSESGNPYAIIIDKNSNFLDSSATVPQGFIFLLGDNRSNSADSRLFGAVPIENVVGRARTVYFSHSKASGVRFYRSGTSLQVNN